MNALLNAALGAGKIAIIVGVAIAVVALAVGIAILAVKLKKRAVSKGKQKLGEYGEEQVAQILGATQKGKKYVINDYSVAHEGRTFQTDHIYINERGIFVIETKNWAGEVYGTEDAEVWKQYHGHGKYAAEDDHPNPIKQNSGHVYHISRILGGKYYVEPLIVMANNNGGRIESDKVVDLRDLAEYLELFGEPMYSPDDMENIYNILVDYQKHNAVSHREHLSSVERTRELIKKGVCPQCGGNIVLRHGPHGDFYGCSNFPRCKFRMKKQGEE